MARSQPTPPCLWRIFSDKAHAESFVERGVVRLGHLKIYQKIEDSGRRDSGEGEAIFRAPGIETTMYVDQDRSIPTETIHQQGFPKTHFSSTPRTYVYCCSYPPRNDPSLLLKRFGKYRVKICDPQKFVEQIAKVASEHSLARESTTAECIPVSYDKGERRERDPSDPIELSYSQKYPKFAPEHEYRIVVRVRLDFDNPDRDLPDFISLKLPTPLAYAEYCEGES